MNEETIITILKQFINYKTLALIILAIIGYGARKIIEDITCWIFFRFSSKLAVGATKINFPTPDYDVIRDENGEVVQLKGGSVGTLVKEGLRLEFDFDPRHDGLVPRLSMRISEFYSMNRVTLWPVSSEVVGKVTADQVEDIIEEKMEEIKKAFKRGNK